MTHDPKLICSVCFKNNYAYLRCSKPDCPDGRSLLRVAEYLLLKKNERK